MAQIRHVRGEGGAEGSRQQLVREVLVRKAMRRALRLRNLYLAPRARDLTLKGIHSCGK